MLLGHVSNTPVSTTVTRDDVGIADYCGMTQNDEVCVTMVVAVDAVADGVVVAAASVIGETVVEAEVDCVVVQGVVVVVVVEKATVSIAPGGDQ
jgi:hypothetical protein